MNCFHCPFKWWPKLEKSETSCKELEFLYNAQRLHSDASQNRMCATLAIQLRRQRGWWERGQLACCWLAAFCSRVVKLSGRRLAVGKLALFFFSALCGFFSAGQCNLCARSSSKWGGWIMNESQVGDFKALKWNTWWSAFRGITQGKGFAQQYLPVDCWLLTSPTAILQPI